MPLGPLAAPRRALTLAALVLALGVTAAAAPPAGAAPPGLATTWCGDGADHADASNAQQWKVVYAFAAGQPNRLASQPLVGFDIQNALRDAVGAVASESGQTRTLRIDQGTNCGPQYVDIRAVPLKESLSAYIGTALKQQSGCTNDGDCSVASWRKLSQEMTDDGLLGGGERFVNVLMFLDTMDQSSVFPFFVGRGSLPLAATTAGIDNPSNQMNGFSVVWPQADPSYDGLLPTDPVIRAEQPLHEMLHNIGAVAGDAPHATPYGHCWDHNEVMCYPDGGPWQANATCGPADGSWSFTLTIDCNKDDYFNTAPAPGTYLATHWNTADSQLLCPIAWCGVATAPPQVTLGASNGQPAPGEQVTLTANAAPTGDDAVAGYEWSLDDVWGPEVVTQGPSVTVPASWGAGITREFLVRARAVSGAYADARVAVTPRAPAPPPGPGAAPGAVPRVTGTVPPRTPQVALTFASATASRQSARRVAARGLVLRGRASGAASVRIEVRLRGRLVAAGTFGTDRSSWRLRPDRAARRRLLALRRGAIRLTVTVTAGGRRQRFAVLCVPPGRSTA